MHYDRFPLLSKLQPLLPQVVLSAAAAATIVVVIVALDVLVYCDRLQGVLTSYNCNISDF
jgi:hypothetical protein